MNLIIKSLFIIIILSVFSCENKINNFGRTLIVKDNEDQFRKCAILFIDRAKKGNLIKMIDMTSEITKNKSGLSKVKEAYETRLIPEFAGKNVSWNRESKLIFDEQNNAGYLFSGKAKGTNDFFFSVTVFGEGGEYVIGTIIR